MTRSSWGANPQRTVFNLDFNFPVSANEARRETFQFIVNLEGDSGFGRREGMANCCMPIDCSQRTQDALVHDLTRETDVAWRNRAGSRTHQCTPPMRWSA